MSHEYNILTDKSSYRYNIFRLSGTYIVQIRLRLKLDKIKDTMLVYLGVVILLWKPLE